MVLSCNEPNRSVILDYGDSRYMVFDSITYSSSISDSNYVFKEILLDGEYFAYDIDTALYLNSLEDNSSVELRKYLRKYAKFKDGKRIGQWSEWIYLPWEDSTFVSSETIFENGYYKSFISYHPGTSDTFMVNIYPDSAKDFGDWTIYKEFQENRINIVEVIDTLNTVEKITNKNGELLTYYENYISSDSACISAFNKNGELKYKEIYTNISENDSASLVIYDSINAVVFKGVVKTITATNNK